MAPKRIDFRVGSFDDMIIKHGYHLEHSKALQCPCLRIETGQPDPLCPYCDRGWQYYNTQPIQGIITSLQTEKQFIDSGGMLIGSMQLTVNADTELGYHDRIVNRKSVINYSELMFRGVGETDAGRFNMIDILRVVGRDGVVFTPAVHYEVAGGEIKWLAGAPAEGERYSIAYKTNPSWLVLSMTHVVRDVDIKFRQPAPVHHRLPIQALCKLEYLVEI